MLIVVTYATVLNYWTQIWIQVWAVLVLVLRMGMKVHYKDSKKSYVRAAIILRCEVIPEE